VSAWRLIRGVQINRRRSVVFVTIALLALVFVSPTLALDLGRRPLLDITAKNLITPSYPVTPRRYPPAAGSPLPFSNSLGPKRALAGGVCMSGRLPSALRCPDGRRHSAAGAGDDNAHAGILALRTVLRRLWSCRRSA
jgi:hypothetical protein